MSVKVAAIKRELKRSESSKEDWNALIPLKLL